MGTGTPYAGRVHEVTKITLQMEHDEIVENSARECAWSIQCRRSSPAYGGALTRYMRSHRVLKGQLGLLLIRVYFERSTRKPCYAVLRSLWEYGPLNK